jgi:hypothetical protein
MGELDLDNIKRLLSPEWQDAQGSGQKIGKHREVIIHSEDSQFRCAKCGRPPRGG